MKILIYGLHFKPDLVGIGKYTGELADWLHQHGHEIRVITAPHFYPDWEITKKQWGYKKEKENYKVWRCPIYVPAKPRSLTRLLHLLSFAVSSVPVLLRNFTWKPDYIISIEPPFFTSPMALCYAWFTKSQALLHIQDLEIDAAYSLNILKKGILYKYILKIEKYILNKFDTISTISLGMKNELIKKGIDENKIYILPNWADIDKIHPKIDNDYLKKRLGLSKTDKIILYAGNMGEKQNLISVINVAKKMNNGNNTISFILVGEGAVKKRLENEVLKRNIINVTFLPLQPEADLGALLTLADIHLITQDQNISDYVLPSKLTNILSVGGVAIVSANHDTQLSNLIEKYDIGYLVKPNSEEELLEAITELISNETELARIGKNARKYAEQYLSQDQILTEFASKFLNK